MPKRMIALLSAPVADYWQIDLLEVDRGIQHALTRDNNRYGFMWSLDGQEIGFLSRLTGNTVMDWTGHNRYPMSDSDLWITQFAYNPSQFDGNSRWNVSGTERVFESNFKIYICDAECKNAWQVTKDGTSIDRTPAWSPDGKQIMFSSDRNGYYSEIYIMNRDGTAIQRLTDNNVDDIYPAWSADSQQIAFSRFVDGSWEIFVMNVDGTNSRRLTHNHLNDVLPTWQPGNS